MAQRGNHKEADLPGQSHLARKDMEDLNTESGHRPLYGADDLRPLIAPNSVAVAGASSRAAGFGARALFNAKRSGMTGPVWAINPNHQTLDGVPSWPSVAKLPDTVDCLIVAVPASGVPEVVEDALANHKARSVLVISSGIGEMGEEGRAIEARLGSLARRYRAPICGPNTVGIFNFRERKLLSFLTDIQLDTAPVGRLAVVSQSAGLGVGVVHSRYRGAGFSHCLNAGNSCDVDVLDFASYLLSDPDTDVVALMLEGLRNPRALLEIGVLSRQMGKPVIFYKTGRGERAGRVAQSHTGSMIGDFALYQSAIEESGVIGVDSIEELLETALFVTKAPKYRGRGVGVMTTSGGCAVIAADHADEFGVDLPEPSANTVSSIRKLAADYAAVANPADLTASMSSDWRKLTDALVAFSEDPGYSAVIVPVPAPDTGPASHERPQAICAAADRSEVPLCVVWLSGWLEGPGSEVLDAHPKIAMFRSLRRCMQAVKRWGDWHESRNLVRSPVAKLDSKRLTEIKSFLDEALAGHIAHESVVLDEVKSRRLLELAGVPLVRAEFVKTPEEAVAAAKRLGFPVVIKAVMQDLAHKSDVGGVELSIRDQTGVTEACNRILSNVSRHCPGQPLDGFLVSVMEAGGFEALVGAKRDVLFGPIVVGGVGGTAVETLKDIGLGLAPLSTEAASVLIGNLKSAPRLRGGRGVKPFDTNVFASAIVSVGQLMAAEERIAEIDVNPFLLRPSGDGAVALDALVVCRVP